MHCENKNHEILRYAVLCNIMNTWLDLFCLKALKSLLCKLEVLLRLIQKQRSQQMLQFTYQTRWLMEITASKIISEHTCRRLPNYSIIELFI